MSEPLELRVLSGLHREATCPARNDAVLGADPECDVVLADAGVAARAARLRVGARGWDLAPEGDGPLPGGEPATPFNQPLPLGPVWITVARCSDPWTPLPEAANDGSAGAALPTGDSAAARPDRCDDDTARNDAETKSPPAAAVPASPPAKPGRRRGASWLMALGLGTVVLAILAAVLLTWLLPDTQQPARPDPRHAAQLSLGRIQAAIERLGLASRLHVGLSPDGRAVVSGWVRNAGERDALAAALAQIWPMPAMRISSEADAVSTASAALASHDFLYEPRYDGDGRLTVRGIAPNAETRAAALESVRAALPGMTVMGNDIMLAAAVADALVRELDRAGLGGVALSWRDRRLQAGAGGMDADQLAVLKGVLDRFNASHLGVAVLAPDSARQYANTVPFGIRSVVGGDTPYIVLENGSKLLVGGTYKRYRLTAIEEKRLVFDGPQPAIVLR